MEEDGNREAWGQIVTDSVMDIVNIPSIYHARLKR